ncbi:MAG: TPM domain-containing protein [Bacteroidota bacterium]
MKKVTLLLLLTFVYLNSNAQVNFPAKPTNYVSDDAALLSSSEQEELNLKLKGLEEKSSNQVFIYISKSLNGNNLEDYTQQIFDAWQVGQKGKDNGVLITVFIDDRKFRIQTGYGVEAILPDVTCNAIQDEYIIPNFKNEDYFDGLNQASDAIISIIGGKSIKELLNEKEYNPSMATTIVAAIVSLLLFLILKYVKADSTRKKTIKKVFVIAYIVSLLLVFIAVAMFTSKMNYQLLLQSYNMFGFNFLVALLSTSFIEEYCTSNTSKKVNYFFLSFFITTIIIAYTIYCYDYNIQLINLNDLGITSDIGILAFVTTGVNLIYMFGLFMHSAPSSGSSGGSSYSSSSSSSYSSSSSSYSSGSSSSYSSGSSFSGGGGGRSGGGGSSGSW